MARMQPSGIFGVHSLIRRAVYAPREPVEPALDSRRERR